MRLTKYFKSGLIGRMAILKGEDELLKKYAALAGDHVEIGCLWGGTAILAALAKINAGVKGHVYSIDKMSGGYWERGDPGVDYTTPTEERVRRNIERMGVQDRITVIRADSNPLPLPSKVKPVTVLIDGAHSFDGCLRDWENVKRLAPKFVLFHDYGTGKHPGVQAVVDEHVRKDAGWELVDQEQTMLAFGRVDK